ncbi:hypothetical protein BESB_026860 [Besnoitia besnoiti]|uniref:TAF6 C-terminal HEAT repeat domain-containing protein n=1 Tax=Besnoitia besnoiti TaxID=94643 RepID=A0A2A9M8J7_BESBE|nr:uncharacterized protein BESB_026860 [Besnoitia besnoiti]PFH31712.1 hypothetical protein BESB_026860 [Besnoitia besnoiti]
MAVASPPPPPSSAGRPDSPSVSFAVPPSSFPLSGASQFAPADPSSFAHTLPTSSLMTSHVLSIARTHGYCSAPVAAAGAQGPGPRGLAGDRGDRRPGERAEKLEHILALQETLVKPGAAKVIGSMVQFRLMQVIKTAKKLMEQSARVAQEGVLTVGDVQEAMSMLNMPPLLWYSGPSTYRFVTGARPLGQEAFRLVRRETLRPFEGPSALGASASVASASGASRPPAEGACAGAMNAAVGVEGMLPRGEARRENAAGASSLAASMSSAPASSRLLDLIYADLKLPAPREEGIGIHWMAVAGRVPLVPQNLVSVSRADGQEPERRRREKPRREEEDGARPRWALTMQIYDGERRKRPRAGDSENGEEPAPRSSEADDDAKTDALEGERRWRQERRRKRLEERRKHRGGGAANGEDERSSGASTDDDSEEDERWRDQATRSPSWPLSLERILIAPRLCHALGKEHQQFLQAVRDALQAGMEEKHGIDYERNFRKMLKIVSSIPGLEQLLPCLARFFSVELSACLHLPHRATLLLHLAEAILENPHLSLHSHVHQFLLPLLECLLRPLPLTSPSTSALAPEKPAPRHAAPSALFSDPALAAPGASLAAAFFPFTPQQLELRRKAAALLGAFLRRARMQREHMEGVEAAILLQLKRHLLHPQSSLETVLGAVWGILALGRPAFLLLLFPVLPLLLHTLERVRSLGELQMIAASAGLRMKSTDAASSQGDEREGDRAASSGVFAETLQLKSRDFALLQQHQDLAALRMLLIDQLLLTLLSCVYDELSVQLTAATSGAAAILLPGEETSKSLGIAAPALLQLMLVLYDESRSLNDAYTPFVAAALHRAVSSRLPSFCGLSRGCASTPAGSFTPEKEKLRQESLAPSEKRKRAVRDFVAGRVLPALQRMELSLDAEPRGDAKPRGEKEGPNGAPELPGEGTRAVSESLYTGGDYLLAWTI